METREKSIKKFVDLIKAGELPALLRMENYFDGKTFQELLFIAEC